MNARALFDEAKRPELLKENAGLNTRELASRIGKLWEGLTAEERKPFEQRAQAFKDAYQFELDEYKETPAYKAYLKAIVTKKEIPAASTGRGVKRKKRSDLDDLGLDSDEDLMGSDSDCDSDGS